MWGYAAAIADVRVSFPDGSVLDCVRKVHAVGPDIAAGFSGSVRFGFWTIEDLVAALGRPPANHAWIPGRVIWRWYRRARRAFAGAPAEEQALGSSVMLLGVSPSGYLGLPMFPRPTVAVLRSPGFEPTFVDVNKAAAIGSGTAIEIYMGRLSELFGVSPLFQLESVGSGASMAAITHVVHRTIAQHPAASVSPYLHLCVVRRGGVTITNNDAPTFFSDGRREDLRMPPVAATWDEFENLCRANGLSAAGAAA
jgi:hypothetical protein